MHSILLVVFGTQFDLKALGHDISKLFVTKLTLNGTMTAKACRAITRNSMRKTIEYRGDRCLYVTLAPELSDGGQPARDLAPSRP